MHRLSQSFITMINRKSTTQHSINISPFATTRPGTGQGQGQVRGKKVSKCKTMSNNQQGMIFALAASALPRPSHPRTSYRTNITYSTYSQGKKETGTGQTARGDKTRDKGPSNDGAISQKSGNISHVREQKHGQTLPCPAQYGVFDMFERERQRATEGPSFKDDLADYGREERTRKKRR